jgi:two-component system, cell cycle sensor histidine kinase DivJ
LSLIATKYVELMRAVAAGCDRLVQPGVAQGAVRDEQRRLIGMLIVGPFLLSAVAWILLPSGIGVATTFGLICASFFVSGFGALAMTSGRGIAAVMFIALVLATAQIALLVAAGGGLTSPLAAIAVALPVETWLAYRTRRAVTLGLVAMTAALGFQLLPEVAMFPAAKATTWHWLLPLAYAMLALPRMAHPRAPAQALVMPDVETGRIAVSFAASGDLLDIAPSAAGLLGIDPDLLYGSGFFERVQVGDRVGFLCALSELRDGAPYRKLELRLRLPGKGEGNAAIHRPLLVELVRVGGDDVSFAGNLSDNSEVAELRAALAAATESKISLEHAKSSFLAAVSHELRTPLNSIIGFSDMLLCEIHGALANDRQREHVAIVREAGSHLLAVVNSILDVSKIEAGSYATNPEPFPFHEAAVLCGAMVSPQAEQKGVALNLEVQPTLGEINADRRAVQQILINLLSNAIKFTPKGGSVKVGAKRLGSMLHFWISDNGIGIAADDLSGLGTPFAQVQNDHTRHFEGTGLGLALVKGLVSLHEGSMSIDSMPGKGTTVTISLPVDGPSAAGGEDTLAHLPVNAPEEEENGPFRKAS